MTLLTPRTLLTVGTVVMAVSVANPAAASHHSLQNWLDAQANEMVSELTAKTDQTLKVTSWGRTLRGKVTEKLDLVLAEKFADQENRPAI